MAKDKFGILLGVDTWVSEKDLYDAVTGKGFLMLGVPLNPQAPTAQSVKCGIIDSGVLAGHPQLRGVIIAEKAFAGTDPTDCIGHGTMVALQYLRFYHLGEKIISEQLEPAAIISANVVGADGAPRLSAVVEAIHWVVAEGARVVNLSLGFRGNAEEYRELCETIGRYAGPAGGGVIFSAAAGNFGPDEPVYPAACGAAGLIAVGAVESGNVPGYSGRADLVAEAKAVVVPAWEYFFESGLQEEREEQFEAARHNYELSLAEEETPETLVQLAYLDLRAESNLERASRLLQRAQAIESRPAGQAIILGALGSVRMLQERYTEAADLYQEALKLDPGGQMTWFNLGKTLLILSRPQEALAAFEKVAELNPDYPKVGAYMDRAWQQIKN